MRPWVVLVFAVSMLPSCQSQGISTATPVFVEKGRDLHLNVDADVPEDFVAVVWNFNKSQVIVRFLPGKQRRVSSNYTRRLAFPEKNYSVILQNVQEADRGVYTAKLIPGEENDKIVAEYNVTVQDPASPVNLTVVSVDSRSSECNFTVTCRTQDSHINSTFRCDNQTCSQEGGEQSVVTNSGAILHIYLSSSSIICNHSNQVNWTKDLKMREDVCLQLNEAKPPNITGIVIGVCIAAILFVILIITAVYVCRKRGNCKSESVENTVYEVPQPAVQLVNQSPTEDTSPTSTYCLVGPHSGPQEHKKTKDTTVPESLYAQVEKPKAGEVIK